MVRVCQITEVAAKLGGHAAINPSAKTDKRASFQVDGRKVHNE